MPREPADLQLAAIVRELREDREMSQEELAGDAGISTAALSRIETAVSNPTWTTVRRLAGALDISLGELGKLVEIAPNG